MGFCGGCGKQSDPEDKFCTGCGIPLKEIQVSVLEDTGEMIKEEYRMSTAPPESNLTGGSHIGDQRKSGEWLEATVDHILRYAGFETEREASFVFNDSTGDRFRIDVLAKDPQIEIFVECKDYSDMKISEKIMYTLQGQLDDYRKRHTKKVIGILAVTSRDDGRNTGIRESLKKHDSFLWDGSFIEHLKNKMVELGNKEDFRRYVLDQVDIFEAPQIKQDGVYNFMVKYSFYTVEPDRYVGKSFEVMNFIDDIKDKLRDQPIQIINQKFEPFRQNDKVVTYRMILDFNMPKSPNDVKKFANKNKGFMDKLKRRTDFEIVHREYKKLIEGILKDVYGISYVPDSKNQYQQIHFEGYRVS